MFARCFCMLDPSMRDKGCQTRQGMAESVLCKPDPLCSIWHLLCPPARKGQVYPQEPPLIVTMRLLLTDVGCELWASTAARESLRGCAAGSTGGASDGESFFNCAGGGRPHAALPLRSSVARTTKPKREGTSTGGGNLSGTPRSGFRPDPRRSPLPPAQPGAGHQHPRDLLPRWKPQCAWASNLHCRAACQTRAGRQTIQGRLRPHPVDSVGQGHCRRPPQFQYAADTLWPVSNPASRSLKPAAAFGATATARPAASKPAASP